MRRSREPRYSPEEVRDMLLNLTTAVDGAESDDDTDDMGDGPPADIYHAAASDTESECEDDPDDVATEELDYSPQGAVPGHPPLSLVKMGPFGPVCHPELVVAGRQSATF